MQNEFNDNPSFPCAMTSNPSGLVTADMSTGDKFLYGCGVSPLEQVGPMSLSVSLVCLFALYVLCYMISWVILWRLSADHEI